MAMAVGLRGIKEDDVDASGFVPVELMTDQGQVSCRYYPSPGARHAVIMVGGTGGGFDSPARDLYPHLARDLVEEGMASLRIRFRDSRNLEMSIADVIAGIRYLRGKGIGNLALMGHSFGGAVAIGAAAEDLTGENGTDSVRTVITLASQSHGAVEPAEHLGPDCSLLLIHGMDDSVLPAACSERIYDHARHPKEIVVYEADHCLDEVAGSVTELTRAWLCRNLLGHGARNADPAPMGDSRRASL